MSALRQREADRRPVFDNQASLEHCTGQKEGRLWAIHVRIPPLPRALRARDQKSNRPANKSKSISTQNPRQIPLL
jgi:hypothetical protein